MSDQLGDDLWDSVMARAWTAVEMTLEAQNLTDGTRLTLTENERDAVNIGISAGISAALLELQARDMIRAPKAPR